MSCSSRPFHGLPYQYDDDDNDNDIAPPCTRMTCAARQYGVQCSCDDAAASPSASSPPLSESCIATGCTPLVLRESSSSHRHLLIRTLLLRSGIMPSRSLGLPAWRTSLLAVSHDARLLFLACGQRLLVVKVGRDGRPNTAEGREEGSMEEMEMTQEDDEQSQSQIKSPKESDLNSSIAGSLYPPCSVRRSNTTFHLLR